MTKFLFCVWFQKCCLVFQNVTIFNKINSYKYKTTIKNISFYSTLKKIDSLNLLKIFKVSGCNQCILATFKLTNLVD